MALSNGNFASGKQVPEMWTIVESRLSEMVIEHPGTAKRNTEHTPLALIVTHDSMEHQFSTEFSGSCVAKISDT